MTRLVHGGAAVMEMGMTAGGGGAPGDTGAIGAASNGYIAAAAAAGNGDAVPLSSVNAGVVDGYGVLRGIGK